MLAGKGNSRKPNNNQMCSQKTEKTIDLILKKWKGIRLNN
jgi:hypothetical protein